MDWFTAGLPSLIDSLPDGGDPVLMAAKWLALLVAALLLGAAPVMFYLRRFSLDRLDTSRDQAHAEVYETLRQQIREHGEQISLLVEERRLLQTETTILRQRISDLEAGEHKVHLMQAQLADADRQHMRMQGQLDAKDELLEQVTTENRSLLTEILALKERVHDLELRLTRDEESMCLKCGRRIDAAPAKR